MNLKQSRACRKWGVLLPAAVAAGEMQREDMPAWKSTEDLTKAVRTEQHVADPAVSHDSSQQPMTLLPS